MSLEPFLSPELQRTVSVMLIINDLMVLNNCSYSQDQKHVDTEGCSLTYVCLT